jgi:hypothetical protein
MSTIRISQLPSIDKIDANTSNTAFAVVDLANNITGRLTVHTLAQGLFSNEKLDVGSNPIVYDHTQGQFSGSDSAYLQVNMQNFDGGGSSDFVASADDSDDTSRYIDMGINGSNFAQAEFSSMQPYDGYLYTYGYEGGGNPASGNLVIGTATSNANILFIAGGTTSSNIVGRISKNVFDFFKSVRVTGNTYSSGLYFFSDATSQSTAGAPYAYSNSAYAIANTNATNITIAGSYANSAFSKSNTNATDITITASYANSAYTKANTDAVNNTITASYANSAYTKSNTNATDITIVASYANTALLKANVALVNDQGTGVVANAAFAKANVVSSNATIASSYANSAYAKSNTNATDISITASYANSAYNKANTVTVSASAVGQAAYNQSNTNATNITIVSSYANSAYIAANLAQSYSNSAFAKTNSAFTKANTNATDTTIVASYANSAYIKANAAVANTSSITVAGSLTIPGNLTSANGMFSNINNFGQPTPINGQLAQITLPFIAEEMSIVYMPVRNGTLLHQRGTLNVILTNFMPGRKIVLTVVNDEVYPKTLFLGTLARNNNTLSTSVTVGPQTMCIVTYYCYGYTQGYVYASVVTAAV